MKLGLPHAVALVNTGWGDTQRLRGLRSYVEIDARDEPWHPKVSPEAQEAIALAHYRPRYMTGVPA